MPTETKNSTAKASRKGSTSAPTWWLRGDSLTTTPARNAPRASDTPKSAADPRAVPRATVRATSRNSSRERVRATRRRTKGTTRVAQEEHENDEGRGLGQGDPEHAGVEGAPAPSQRGQHQEQQDGGEVFQHQPTHGQPARPRAQEAVVHETPEQDDRAGHRDGQTQHETGLRRPAPEAGQAVGEKGREGHLPDRPRHGHRPHPPEIAQGEMQTDSEHQEDDAQLRQLRDGRDVAHEAGVNGPMATPARR